MSKGQAGGYHFRMDISANPRPFKLCGSCGRPWPSWDEFVADPQVRLLGLQAVANVPDASLLVFEHRCGSSISVLTKRLHHLVPDPHPEWPSLRGTDSCPRHCFALEDHGACDRRCANSRDRDILQLVERIHANRSG